MQGSLDVQASSNDAGHPAWLVWWRVAAWSLLVGWLVTLVLVLVSGEREVTPAHLRADVLSGEATEVRLGTGQRLVGQVEVHWRTGVTSAYRTTISAKRLDALEVAVVTTPGQDGPWASSEMLGREIRADGWYFWAGAAMFLGTVGLLGTRPWLRRGTAWGWLWPVLLLPPVGPLAYLLLGGPIGPEPRSQPSSRGLTGGWSFLLCIAVAAALSAG